MSDEAKPPAVKVATDEVLFWSAVRDAVVGEYDAARVRIEQWMRATGSERQRGRDAAGLDLGTVSLGVDDVVAKVIDEDKFLDWVIENHPTEQYTPPTTPKVRDAFRRKVLGLAEQGGELPPGVELEAKPGTLTVRSSRWAKDKARAFVSGTNQDAIEVAPPAP